MDTSYTQITYFTYVDILRKYCTLRPFENLKCHQNTFPKITESTLSKICTACFFQKSFSSNFTRENMSWCSFSQYITLRVPKTMTLSFHSSTVKFLATEQKKTAVIHLEAKMSSLYELSYYTVFRLRIIKLDLPP